MSTQHIGPVRSALVVVPDLAVATAAYVDHLHLRVHRKDKVAPSRAESLARPDLAGRPTAHLGALSGDHAWLELVESAEATPIRPFHHPGWLALEVCVQDVDALGERLQSGPFSIAGEPAFLSVGEAVRAMQVVGPGGEVLYLTEIRDDLPPFELPRAKHPVDHLFIPVLAASHLDHSLRWMGQLPVPEPLRFNSRITSMSRALGRPVDSEYSVATVQLNGRCLFEVDQLPQPAERKSDNAMGVISISVAANNGDRGARQGPDGEWLELVD